MERFIEMPVIGAMLLLSLFPILAIKHRFSGAYRRFLRMLRTPARVGVLVGIAFVVGVVGNQLVDESFNAVSWAIEKVTGENKDKDKDKKKDKDACALPKDVVEYVVAGDNEYARNYFERHRLFMRIDRAGFVAMILLLISMLIYRVRAGDRSHRYFELMIGVMAVAFFVAYMTERDAIENRAGDLCDIVNCQSNGKREGGPTAAQAIGD